MYTTCFNIKKLSVADPVYLGASFYTQNKEQFCKIWGAHNCSYDKFYLLEHNACSPLKGELCTCFTLIL
jgi:hypothetical protein